MAGNVKKGSITIFLALILSLVLSLVCASIESVRMAAARTQILNSMDIGLYSLFGQYDRTLLEDYELFALYAGGKEELDMASVYDDFQTYMKPSETGASPGRIQWLSASERRKRRDFLPAGCSVYA